MKLFNLMSGTVIISFLGSLKIKNFILDSVNESSLVLSQRVTNFSSLFMAQDISEGDLFANNELLSSGK